MLIIEIKESISKVVNRFINVKKNINYIVCLEWIFSK